MLNTLLTLKIKALLALLAATALVSGALTYTVIQMTTPASTAVCPTFCPTPAASTPQPKPIPRERYFKVHKSKLDGERF